MIKKKLIELETSEIKAYSRNNKKHWSNVDEIVKSIQANTYVSPIIVDENNVILAWHGRKLAMDKLWVKKTEVLQVTWLSETQKKDFRIRDNKLTELSQWDFDNLKLELLDIDNKELNDLFEWVFDDITTTDEKRKEEIEDDVPEVDDDQVTVKYWDMYKIWHHVLMCWDSMKDDDIQKLIKGIEKRTLHCISDPPYWIAYNPDNHWMIMNDDKILDYVWLAQKYTNWYFAMRTGYQVCDIRKQLIEKYFKKVNNMIIRHKWWGWMWDCARTLAQDFEILYVVNRWNLIQSDRIGAFRNWNKEEKLERIAKAKKEDMQHLINTMIQWTVTWKVGKDNNTDYMHPTQKPVEINEKVLINFTSKWEYVLDLFWGSWSNMIACEKTGRVCHMMELDPKYCQVIIERMRMYDPSITINKI